MWREKYCVQEVEREVGCGEGGRVWRGRQGVVSKAGC